MTTLNRPGAPDGHVCGIDAAMEVIGGKWKVLIHQSMETLVYDFGLGN